MISRPESDRDPNRTVQTAGASAREGARDGTGREESWSEENREELASLAASLAGPDLHPKAARGRLAALEGQGASPAEVRIFLEAEIPAARARGASYPLAAALSRWETWRTHHKAPRPTTPARAPEQPLPGPPPPPRAPGEARTIERLPEAQIRTNVEGARAILAALRSGKPAPRPFR